MPPAFDKHISLEELETLLNGKRVSPELEAHLASCAQCAHRLALNQAAEDTLLNLRGAGAASGASCAPPEIWWDLAAGRIPDPADLLEHASSCNLCGNELHAALAASEFQDLPPAPLTKWSSSENRASLAARMAEEFRVSPTIPRILSWRQIWHAAAIAASLAIVTAVAWLALRGPSASSLIARAYEEKRTFEFRMPGAAPVPLRQERGTEDRLNRTVPLLEAEVAVSKALALRPGDAGLLEEKARIELLNWNYRAAFPLLVRAGEERPEDSEILEDVALAYFERGRAEDRSIDLGSAVETLGRILLRHPDDRVALFNRAIALESQFMYRQAIDDWEHVLRVESSGGWAEEARKRLAALRAKTVRREKGTLPCSALTAVAVAKWLSPSEIAERIQPYDGTWDCLRQKVLLDWLPAATGRPSEPNLAVRGALRASALAFRSEDGDTWLDDLLAAEHSPRFASAIIALSEAVDANMRVDADHAAMAARKAQAIFTSIGCEAGAARSAIEYDYAIRRSQHPSECLAAIASLQPLIDHHSWFRLLLEEKMESVSCLALAGHDLNARNYVREVVRLSVRPQHMGLHLRALSYLEGLEGLAGDYSAAWSHGIEGLRQFWSGRDLAVWAYQLYYHLALDAEARGQDQLALQLNRETLAEIRLASRPTMEAFSTFDYARAASRAGSIREARTAFDLAGRLFTALPPSRALNTLLDDTAVYRAEIDLLQGHPEAALARLNEVTPRMQRDNSFSMELRHRRDLARADKLLGKADRYREDLRLLIGVSRRGLASGDSFQDRIRWTRETGDAYRDYISSLVTDPRNTSLALDIWESSRAALYGSKAPSSIGLSESETPRTFSAHGVSQALVYVAAEDRLLIWVIKDEVTRLLIVPVPQQRIQSLSRRLYLLCSQPASSASEWRFAARELAGFLIAPVEAQLSSGQPVWVELDEPIGQIPFAVLPLRSGVPLGTVYSVSLLPGADFLKTKDVARAISTESPALSVGIADVPENSRGLAPLAAAIEELEEISRLFPHTRVLYNRQATARDVERELPRSVVFDFVGHSRNTAEKAALLLDGPDGEELAAELVATMDLKRCRLAILSTCSAEAPEFFDESRPFGVALAFLRAGASTVLAPRWDLDSSTASLFTRRFLQYLAAGEIPARAAQQAALEIYRNTATAHPYYWAAYQLFGLG